MQREPPTFVMGSSILILHKAVAMRGYLAAVLILGWTTAAAYATPINKSAYQEHYGRFLAKRLDACISCHLPATLSHTPRNLAEFPHNAFGARLAALGKELHQAN